MVVEILKSTHVCVCVCVCACACVHAFKKAKILDFTLLRMQSRVEVNSVYVSEDYLKRFNA
jgi:hypothetical protein